MYLSAHLRRRKVHSPGGGCVRPNHRASRHGRSRHLDRIPTVTTPEQPPRRPAPPRPVPPRPEFAVTPLRTAPTDSTPKAVTVSLTAWVGSFVVLVGIAGAVALDLRAVRDALEASVAAENPADSAQDIT